QARLVSLKTRFQPAELQIIEDRVIFSPTDGKVLLCLDGASGEPLWMLSKEPRPRRILKSVLENMSYVIGRDDNFLYVMCYGGQVLCVDFRSGTRMWAARVPGSGTVGSKWYGRGVVADGYVAVPGSPESRTIHVLPTRGQRIWSSIDLPAFGISKEALKGPFNLQLRDSYLAVCYEGGIELFSSVAALMALANQQTDPKDKAAYLVHARRRKAALQQLRIAVSQPARPEKERVGLARQALSLAGEIAVREANKKNRAAALAVLDSCEAWLDDPGLAAVAPRLRRRWHLARLDVFRILRDIQGMEQEQDIIELGGSK
ncbi:MAG: PQQ-binding-like beta-propeller repeat protein, partial [Planctomycetota bacterium]